MAASELVTIVGGGYLDVAVYRRPDNLPPDLRKFTMCQQHIADGGAGELFDEFMMAGYVEPAEGEDPSVQIQFSCGGLRRYIDRNRRCRLVLTQLGKDDEELAHAEATS